MPRSPQAVEPAWLTGVLCRGIPGVRVTEIRRVDASAGTTTRARLEVTYAGPAGDLPTRLFAKCANTVAQRLMLGLGGFIEAEARFYAHIRPALEVEAPIGYFAAVDRRSWRSIVLLEDVVSSRGATFWDPSVRITRSQIHDLLANAAACHGSLWEAPQLAQWTWLRTPAEHMHLIDALIGLADRRHAGARRARDVIPPPLRDRQTDLYAGLRRSMVLASRGPRTYLHGDLHVANTYVTASEALGIADWQVGLQGSWVHDYAYLVCTALEIEDRRAWEKDLLAFYLDRLRAAGGERIELTRAWEDYRRATLYPYFAWIYTLGRARLQPKFQPERASLTMIRRIAAAIADLDSLGAVGL